MSGRLIDKKLEANNMNRKMKFFICAILIISLLSGFAGASANTRIVVVLEGVPLQFDVPPDIIDGRTMVPMRVIFEALGAQVSWDANTRTITATADGLVVQTTIGDRIIRVNGEATTMDVAPVILGGRTLVPARFVSEAFGSVVNWDAPTRVVYIDSTALRLEQNELGDGIVIEKWYDEYDRLIRETTREGDRVSNFLHYVFNADGIMTRVNVFGALGALIGWTEYEHNENGSTTRSIFFVAGGATTGWTENRFGEQGEYLGATSYDADGVIISWSELEYDAQGNIVAEIWFNADGSKRD